MLSDEDCHAGFALPAESWYALRVRSNCERTAWLSLSQKGLETFLPTYRSIRRRWDRTVRLEIPLFPGYLFCRFDFHRRLPILMTPGVVHIVGGAAEPSPVPEEEIAAVRAIVDSCLRAEPWPFLKVGELVRIVDGPLRGIEGILVGLRDKQRLVVSITLLQRSVAVLIDAVWAKPLGMPAARAVTTGWRQAVTASA